MIRIALYLPFRSRMFPRLTASCGAVNPSMALDSQKKIDTPLTKSQIPALSWESSWQPATGEKEKEIPGTFAAIALTGQAVTMMSKSWPRAPESFVTSAKQSGAKETAARHFPLIWFET
jgi:hypothetical protein